MKVLVTGANGFVGEPLCQYLSRFPGVEVIAAVRDARTAPSGVMVKTITGIDGNTDWSHALVGVDAVVHLAAHVHQMGDEPGDSGAYQTVNVDGTLNLARQSAASAVTRFVFVSSVKACGEGQTDPMQPPYSETSPCQPVDAYGRSKRAAELGLRDTAVTRAMEVVVLRPPLVYGPGVKANFWQLMRWVDRGWPLPLGGIVNRRDLIYVENLADAIATSLVHPVAAGGTFFVSDGVPLSTPELIRHIASALGRSARLVSVPPAWLRILGTLSGQRPAINRLLGSMMVDDSAIRRAMDWQPPYSPEIGLQKTAAWYSKYGRLYAETTS